MTRKNTTAPGASTGMRWYECAPGIYEIDEFDCASCFLVVGEEKALLIDTGVGIGDLKWLVENELTELQRQTILAYYFQQQTITEIARDRGVNKSTVCRTLHRAEERLRKYLTY